MAQEIIYTNRPVQNPGATGTYMVSRILWFLLYVVEALLVVRFILKAVGANAAASFSSFIYNFTQPLVNPFSGIARSVRTGTAGGIIEWSTIVAIVIYWLVAYAIIWLVTLPMRSRTANETTVEEKTVVNRPDYYEDDLSTNRPGYNTYQSRRQYRL